MNVAKLLYAIAYSAPIVAFVLACALIGYRLREWRGLVVGSAIPTFLVCVGRAYNFAQANSAPSEPTRLDAAIAMGTAVLFVTIAFVALREAKGRFLEIFESYGRWSAVAVVSTAVTACLGLSLAAVNWSYHRLLPLDEATLGNGCWIAIMAVLSSWAMDFEKPKKEGPSELSQLGADQTARTAAKSPSLPAKPKSQSAWNINRPDKAKD